MYPSPSGNARQSGCNASASTSPPRFARNAPSGAPLARSLANIHPTACRWYARGVGSSAGNSPVASGHVAAFGRTASNTPPKSNPDLARARCAPPPSSDSRAIASYTTASADHVIFPTTFPPFAYPSPRVTAAHASNARPVAHTRTLTPSSDPTPPSTRTTNASHATTRANASRSTRTIHSAPPSAVSPSPANRTSVLDAPTPSSRPRFRPRARALGERIASISSSLARRARSLPSVVVVVSSPMHSR